MKKKKLDIIYEDKDIIAVNKKCGILTMGTKTEKERTLYHEVREYINTKNQKVFIVHRLDKTTSGIVLFAKSERNKKYLQDNWNDYKRKYKALLHGKLKDKKGRLESKLKENKNFYVYEARDGKVAITDYEVKKENNNYSLVDIIIRTGRKNQIRVQFANIGNPVVGDTKYGKNLKSKATFLHHHKLTIIHPRTKKELELIADLPDYFNDAI